MEELMVKFLQNQETAMRNLEIKFMQNQVVAIQNLETMLRQEQAAAIWNLKMQVGQMAKMIFRRPQGSLPSNKETNLREQINAIMLKSGKELEEPHKKEETEEEITNKELTNSTN